MAIEIDFENLDLRAALDFAIGIEEDAQLRYQEFVLTVNDPGAVKFFREMVRAEGEHRRHLESRRDVLFRHGPTRFDTSIVGDLDAPSVEDVGPAITAREAMEVALRAEVRAYEFYASAIPYVKNPDVRAFFEELKLEEAEHQALIRQRLEALEKVSS